MKKILFSLTDELLDCIDVARGSSPRNPWLEKLIKADPRIQKASAALDIELPQRPTDGRGKWERPDKD